MTNQIIPTKNKPRIINCNIWWRCFFNFVSLTMTKIIFLISKILEISYSQRHTIKIGKKLVKTCKPIILAGVNELAKILFKKKIYIIITSVYILLVSH